MRGRAARYLAPTLPPTARNLCRCMTTLDHGDCVASPGHAIAEHTTGRPRVPPGTHCADPPSTNRSLPVLEPVCECRKRKLKKCDQRRAAETYRLGAGSSPFLRQETWVTGPNLQKCRGFIQSPAGSRA
jgi:hypothetical protein